MTLTVVCNYRQRDGHTSVRPICDLHHFPNYPDRSHMSIRHRRHLSAALTVASRAISSNLIYKNHNQPSTDISHKLQIAIVKPLSFLSIWRQNAFICTDFHGLLLERIHFLWPILWICFNWIRYIWIFYLNNNDFFVIFDATNFNVATTIVHVFVLYLIYSYIARTCSPNFIQQHRNKHTKEIIDGSKNLGELFDEQSKPSPSIFMCDSFMSALFTFLVQFFSFLFHNNKIQFNRFVDQFLMEILAIIYFRLKNPFIIV